jgi:octaprenyl-diphosphate synthase
MANASGGDPEVAVDLAVASELLHNATLLHDDVVDRGHFRRGVAAAPKVYGNSASVLVGDYLLAQGFGIVVKHGNMQLLRELSRVVAAMAEGEILQLVRSCQTTMSKPNYEEIISGKTAGLFSWCCFAGAMLGNTDNKQMKAASEYGRLFGMAFQITDDILDYTATPEQSGKDLANDLCQGKTTLPLLFACEEDQKIVKKIEAIYEREPTQEECIEIVKRVMATSAIKKAQEQADRYVQDSKNLLKLFPASAATDCLVELAQYILHRVPTL